MAKFDQVWIENRLRYRKGMRGTALKVNDETGYMEPITKRGFSSDMKVAYIKRFTVCSNQAAIAKSLNVDIQSVYDAVVLDKKFREDFIKCNQIMTRSKQLNNELMNLVTSEKSKIIDDLNRRMEDYK